MHGSPVLQAVLIAPVPGQLLITTITGQYNLQLLARQLADQIRGNLRRVGEGFIINLRQMLNHVQCLIRRYIDFVVLRL